MIILGTNSIKDTGYDVANSCRFFNNTQLKRTNGSPTNAYKGTFSAWVKRSALSSTRLFQNMVDGNNYAWLAFNSSHQLEVVCAVSGSTYCDYKTNRLFRDVSAWYHIVVEMDTTEGTATNRMKFYVNGVQETSFATQTFNGGQNSNHPLLIASTTNYHTIGASEANTLNLDGYMTEVVLLDGQALDPTSFGEFDEDSGIWKPIDVSDLTFGNNGYYLDFEDSSALGNDVSGNNNDFTANNLTAIDQSTDTCTNNFATGNPLDNGCGKAPTFSEGNLKYVSASTFNFALPTIGVSSGKWYMEIKFVALGEGGSIMAGITDQFDNTNRDLTGNAFAGGEPLGIGYYQNGNKYLNNVASSYGSTYTTGDIIGVYLDVDNSKLYFAKNGTLQNSGTGLDLPSSANSTGVFFFMPSVDKATIEVNYGNPTFTGTDKADANGYGSFEYDPSVGTFDGASKDFYALNTKNLAEYG